MMKRRLTILTLAALAMLAASCGSDSGTGGGAAGNSTPVSGNVVFTSPWKGEWNIVIVFKDCASGDTLNIEDITDVICDGDTLDIGLTDLFEDCDGTITDTRIMVDCTYQFIVGGCTIDVAATLDIERQGDQIMGTGQWSVTTSGTCLPLYIEGCEDIEISGMRIDPNPADCNSPLSLSVTERFAPAPRAFLRAYRP